jgi:hypothetical protein
MSNKGRDERLASLKPQFFVGDVWYKLTVIKVEGKWYEMQCECGNVKRMRHCHLPSFSSCGCRVQKKVKNPVHDHEHYSRWCGIKSRCFLPTFTHYKNYGGRGITMCDKWKNDFWAFVRDIGDRPSPKHELDRIDNDGNYQPDNVRWVVRTANQRNKRNACTIDIDGVKVPLAVACVVSNIDYFCAHGVYRRGNEKLINYFLKKGADLKSIVAYAIENDVFGANASSINVRT